MRCVHQLIRLGKFGHQPVQAATDIIMFYRFHLTHVFHSITQSTPLRRR
jgi:hypothetical protein